MSTLSACPKCGGTVGFKFVQLEQNTYVMDWGGEPVSGDDSVCVHRHMPECIECGARFRWSTIEWGQP